MVYTGNKGGRLAKTPRNWKLTKAPRSKGRKQGRKHLGVKDGSWGENISEQGSKPGKDTSESGLEAGAKTPRVSVGSRGEKTSEQELVAVETPRIRVGSKGRNNSILAPSPSPYFGLRLQLHFKPYMHCILPL